MRVLSNYKKLFCTSTYIKITLDCYVWICYFIKIYNKIREHCLKLLITKSYQKKLIHKLLNLNEYTYYFQKKIKKKKSIYILCFIQYSNLLYN